VLNPNAKAAESVVVRAFVLRERFLFRFLVRNLSGRVIVLKALIATIGIEVSVLRQNRSSSSYFNVMDAAGRRF